LIDTINFPKFMNIKSDIFLKYVNTELSNTEDKLLELYNLCLNMDSEILKKLNPDKNLVGFNFSELSSF
jgi:hypothetical protein